VQYYDIIWNPGVGGNVAHIAKHNLLPVDIENVLLDPIGYDVSRTSGRPIVYGFTTDGRYILVVYEKIDEQTIYPITAYEI